jgi:hypothetical protein
MYRHASFRKDSTCMYVCVCMCVCMHLGTYVRIYVSTYVGMYACTYVRTYVFLEVPSRPFDACMRTIRTTKCIDIDYPRVPSSASHSG